MSAQKLVGLDATSQIFPMLYTIYIVVSSEIVIHCCLKWDLKHIFSAQLVSAQRLSASFLSVNFVPLLLI